MKTKIQQNCFFICRNSSKKKVSIKTKDPKENPVFLLKEIPLIFFFD